MQQRARWHREPGRRNAAVILRWIGRFVIGAILIALVVVLGTAGRVWQVARMSDNGPADAIVVLGAAQYNGVPTDVFQARLDQAASLYRDGAAALIVTVGGKQEGDAFTEAAAGRTYLIGQDVPAAHILAVEEGSDTIESVDAVARELAERGLGSIIITTDPWHSLRTRIMARDAGLDATTAPVRSGPAVWTRESQFKGIARETAALLYYQVTHSSQDLPYAPSL
ncbi:YdcF family protein [Hoyosella sp. G463]|uniref:YdcF family protein n=1 Tax=Lolliginicoccus lacisalsi TaxID=2742202 RepID=A0A927JAJ5_9ACTN|nr:YdcF family protein [Lolliginicoccus lacisalsi]MBD8505600.1 YdcF family protein [Lolliginicoccus lacisalsi]